MHHSPFRRRRLLGAAGEAGEDAILRWAGKTAKVFQEEFSFVPENLTKLERSYALAGDALAAYWPKLEQPEQAVLIGDTQADVEAGHEQGVRVLAVASGRSDETELRQAGAEMVLPSLEDTHLLAKLVREANPTSWPPVPAGDSAVR